MLSRVLAHFTITPPKTPTSLRSSLCVSLRVCIVVSFPESELGKLRTVFREVSLELCCFKYNFRIVFCFCLCVWRHLTTIKKVTSRHFMFEILLLEHAQVRCTRFGRSCVRVTHTPFENRNHRHVITTQLRAQIVTAKVI